MGGDPLQKFNVFLAVESGHVRTRGNVWSKHLKIQLWSLFYNWVEGGSYISAEYLHLLVEPIVEYKGVCDTESVGLHRVQLAIMEVTHLHKIMIYGKFLETKLLVKITHIRVIEVGHLGPRMACCHFSLQGS